jgi:hypothetical protein
VRSIQSGITLANRVELAFHAVDTRHGTHKKVVDLAASQLLSGCLGLALEDQLKLVSERKVQVSDSYR